MSSIRGSEIGMKEAKYWNRVCLCLLVILLATAGLVMLGRYVLGQIGEGQLHGERIALANVIAGWEQAGKPEGEALAAFTQKYAGVFTTNLVLTIDGKSMQAIFAREMTGSQLLVATTNKEFILLTPSRPPRLVLR